MATLREWLTQVGFDWENGVIVYQPVTDEAYSPGWAWADHLLPSRVIPHDHSILDEEFDDGHGAPRCPRFVAMDDKRIYFPVQYDGATWVEWVYKDVRNYVGTTEATPYPGG